MDLQISGRLFLVTGATSGFGKSVAETLLHEGASVIINARNEDPLQRIQQQYPGKVEYVAGDITTDAVILDVIRLIGDRRLDGMLVNAGGPPAKSFIETEIGDWDDAYQRVLRWKVKLTNNLLPKFQAQNYGRIVYIESASVRQPIDNLVLSNSLRLAVVGFVKTLSQEVAREGITCNVVAPGYHATPAMDRLFQKKSTLLGFTPEEARHAFEAEVKMGHLGDPGDLASLAVWLLSPLSRYMTGQILTIDGGLHLGI